MVEIALSGLIMLLPHFAFITDHPGLLVPFYRLWL